MKKMSLLIILAFSTLFADDPCTPHSETQKKFHMEFPYHIIIEKYYTDDGCGYQKTELKIFQNKQLVDKLNAFYGINILFIGDINRDNKTEIVYTGKTAGHGTDEHRIATIEPILKKPFAFGGYALNLVDIDYDGSMEFLSPSSVFSCFSSYFCSGATSPSIQIAKEFKDGSLKIDKDSMKILEKAHARPCKTNVSYKVSSANYQSLEFANNECAKNNLEHIAYDLYLQDLKALQTDISYFTFENSEAKEKFKHQLLNDLTQFENTKRGSDFDIMIKNF